MESHDTPPTTEPLAEPPAYSAEIPAAAPEAARPEEAVPCPICRRPLDLAKLDSGPQTCPCPRNRRFEAVTFRPAALPVPRPRSLGEDSAQPCARHEGNAAEAHCERCGAFICALCQIAIDERTLCPSCFERLDDAKELPSTQSWQRDTGGFGILTALGGFLFWPIGPILGLVAVFFGVKALREGAMPGLGGGRIKAVLALLFGLGTTAFSIFIWMAIVGGIFDG